MLYSTLIWGVPRTHLAFRTLCPWENLRISKLTCPKNNPVQIPKIPSRELTYPIPRHFWRWLSVFPRWDMLVPRRGTYWAALAETQLLQFDGTVPRLFQRCSISQRMHLRSIRPVKAVEIHWKVHAPGWANGERISMEKIYHEHVLRICQIQCIIVMKKTDCFSSMIERIDPAYSRSKLSS